MITILENPPGIILDAKVDGKKARIYVTLSMLDTDGKGRYRYAPGHKKQHELIDKTSVVEVIGKAQTTKMNMEQYRKS